MTMTTTLQMSIRSSFVVAILYIVAPCAAMRTNVQLWNSGTCPYAQRAWIALLEKKIDFELKKVDLKDKSPLFEETYRKSNPNPLVSSKVPVMVVTENDDSEDVYTESRIVVEAAEELWPEPALLPKSALERSKIRLFPEVVYEAIFAGERSAYQIAARKLEGEAWDAQAERASLCESLSTLDKCLKEFTLAEDGPFLWGKRFSMAECVVGPFVQRCDAVLSEICELNVLQICQQEGYDRTAAWWKAVLERESVVESGVSIEKMVEGANRVIEMMRSRRGVP